MFVLDENHFECHDSVRKDNGSLITAGSAHCALTREGLEQKKIEVVTTQWPVFKA